MEDGENFDAVTQPVEGDVRCTADGKATCIAVRQKSSEPRMPWQDRNSFAYTPHDLLGSARIIARDIGTYIVEVVERIIEPNKLIHPG